MSSSWDWADFELRGGLIQFGLKLIALSVCFLELRVETGGLLRELRSLRFCLICRPLSVLKFALQRLLVFKLGLG